MVYKSLWSRTLQLIRLKPGLNIFSASLIIVISVSSASILVKLVSTPASVTAFWRILIALVLITLYYTRNGFSTLKSIFKLNARLALSILSGFSLALHFYTWMSSLKIVEVYLSTTIVCLHPVITLLLSRIVLCEKHGSRVGIGLILAVFGSMLTALSKTSVLKADLQGIVLSLISAFFMSNYVIIGRYVRSRVGLAEHVIPAYSASTITLFVISIIEGYNVVRIDLRDYILLTLLAIGPMIGGHTMLNYLLKYLPASTASLPIVLEPIGASLLAAVILSEYIPLTGYVGVVLATIGLIIIAKGMRS